MNPDARRPPVAEARAAPDAPTLVRTEGDAAPASLGGSPRLNEPFGPYRLTGVIGHGGMALVYRAEDSDGREVALKVLQETPFLPRGMLERFRREAEAARRLAGHPHIVPVLGTGQVGRNHYIAMQLISGGRTLVDVMRAAPLPESQALDLALKIADALALAHREGIIHRDVKPANVLVTEAGEPVLADFGLARLELGAGTNLTVTAMALGTPRYMAPEQATSLKSASHLSDMYSFGVMLYEMLAGQPPYEIDTEMGMEQVIRTIRDRIPPSPRRYRPGLSASVEAVVMKLIEKDPGRRYTTMDAVVSDLIACRNRSRVQASPFSLGRRLDRLVLQHRRPVLLVVLAAGLAAAGLAWHRMTLRAARNRQVVPQAEAVSQALELERLQHQLTDPPTPGLTESGLRQAEEALLTPGGTAIALARYAAERSTTSVPEALRDIDRGVAWTYVAAGRTDESLIMFRGIREQCARQRELRRVAQQDATLRDAKYAIACLDEALATELAAGTTPGAVGTLWERALDELPPQAPQATLCLAAQGRMTAGELAAWASRQRPVHAAPAYLLAGLRTTQAGEREEWWREARHLANPAVPWLYYYLTYGPGAGPQPSVPSGSGPFDAKTR